MTLQEKLASIMELGQEWTVECLHGKVQAWDLAEGVQDCPDCHGTGRKPDPVVKGLVEALDIETECAHCNGTKWEFLPNGALAGALAQWAAVNWIALPNLSYLLCQLFGEPDCDLRAASLVLDFLEKWKGH